MSPRRRTGDPEITGLVEGWLAGRTSPNTRAAYGADLRHFAAWCTEHRVDVLGFDREQLARYCAACEAAGSGRATVARRLAAIRSFGAHAAAAGASATFADVDRPTPGAATRDPALTDGQVRRLLRAADTRSTRCGLLVRLLVLDGLRVSEVAGAAASDLSGRPPRVRLRLPRRTVELHPETATVAQRYLGRRRDGPLLRGEMRGRAGEPLSRFGVDYVVKQVAAAAGLGRDVSGNTLRRRYVVAAVASGTDLEAVARRLGHADARTTRRHLADDAAPEDPR